MSRTFNDSLAQDLESVFFNTNEFAEVVTIKRGSLSTPGIAALSSPSYEVFNQDGMSIDFQARDFDIIATSYVFRGETQNPRQGDRIARADGDEFMVTQIPGRPCFEPVGASGDTMRVHTKKIS